MRKIMLCMIFLMLMATGCKEDSAFTYDLGLDTDRILIESIDEGEFILTVYSGTTWALSVTKGSDWLSASQDSGDGVGYVRFTYGASLQTGARIAEIEVKASTDRKMNVLVIQAGSEEKAADVELDDIL